MAIFNSKLLVYRRVVYDIVLTTPYYHIYIYYYVYYYCICICTYIHIYIYTTKNINKYWFYSNLNWIRYCLELCLSMDCFFLGKLEPESPMIFMGKSMVSCGFSLKPIHSPLKSAALMDSDDHVVKSAWKSHGVFEGHHPLKNGRVW